jgi:hypothetical protein
VIKPVTAPAVKPESRPAPRVRPAPRPSPKPVAHRPTDLIKEHATNQSDKR